MTRNRSSATANSRYSTLTLPPPNKVNSVPAKPTTITVEPVMSIVFSKVSPDNSLARSLVQVFTIRCDSLPQIMRRGAAYS